MVRSLVSVLLLLVFSEVIAQDYPYIEEDFHHRYIDVPLDHRSPDHGTFSLYYELSSNFDFDQPTIFYIVDSQQYAHGADKMAASYRFSDSLNVVLIEYRGRKHSPIGMSEGDGSIDWEKAYRLLASYQALEDIELVRRELFRDRPDIKINMYGRSGGAYLVHEYLSRYPEQVDRAFTRTAPNPLVLNMLGNPESRYFAKSLDDIDPSLLVKLVEILQCESVVPEELLWVLLQLPYRDPNAAEVLAAIVNELYRYTTATYDEYRAKPGYDISKLLSPEFIHQMGIGSFLRPLECDGPYLLAPQPDYIDPLYVTMRYLGGPYIDLINEKRVPPPEYPSLESFKNVSAEVFYLAGKDYHMSPWSVAVELSKWFPDYDYFIADDTPVMSEHPECYPPLRNAFFLHGLDSIELEKAEESRACVEWHPHGVGGSERD